MSKLWNWIKRGSRAQELEQARAAVERKQRALLPYSTALGTKLAAEVSEAEKLWREATAAGERGDEKSITLALSGCAEVGQRLAAVQRALAAEHPELVARELRRRIDELGDELEDGEEHFETWLRALAGHLQAGDEALAQRALARVFEQGEAGAGKAHARMIASLLFKAEKKLGAREWLRAARARALDLARASDESDPEYQEDLGHLLWLQIECGDLEGARASLAGLDERRDEGSSDLCAAFARAGDMAEARALLAEIERESVRLDAQAVVLGLLARREPDQALAEARALADVDARSTVLARIAGARAFAGQDEAAFALVAEVEESWKDRMRHEILDAQLERGDLRAAEQALETFESDEERVLAVRQLSEELPATGDFETAREIAGRLQEPYWRASAFERLAWRRLRAGDGEVARELLARALEIASEVARTGSDPRQPGTVGTDWLMLASRIQVALGETGSALACIQHFRNKLGPALFSLGQICGLVGDLESVELLLEHAPSAFEKVQILDFAAAGVAARAADPGDG